MHQYTQVIHQRAERDVTTVSERGSSAGESDVKRPGLVGVQSSFILIISTSSEATSIGQGLTDSGAYAIKITDYESALEAVRTCRPDLVLLESALNPDRHHLSSLQLLTRIGEKFPSIPVLLIATKADDSSVLAHIEAGAADYLYYVDAEQVLLNFVVRENLARRQTHTSVDAPAVHPQSATDARAADARGTETRGYAASYDSLSHDSESMLRLLERDQQSGFRVQQAMMPESPGHIQGLTFSHQLYPSMIVSGDFIDYCELPDGRAAFYIADVSGHGASSAFITVLLKSLSRRLRDEFGKFGSTAEVLYWFNAELMQWDLEQHITMFFGVIDQENNSLEYSNAAQYPGAILYQESGACFLATGGQPLGLYDRPQFDVHHLELPSVYSIIMFSDGVFEIMSQPTLKAKEEHLLSVVDQPRQDIDTLVEQLGMSNARNIPDDIAIFTVANAK